MIKEVIAQGKDLVEAKENARAALGAGPLDDVNFEIEYLGTKGIFGIGAKPARVKATMEVADPHERKRERPKKERKPESPKREAAAETAEGGESAPAPTHNKPKHKKHNNKKNGERREAKQNDNQKKPQAIPEVELKMERREVADGEDMSYEFVKTLISNIGLDAAAELYSCEDGTRRINVVGNDASVLIGHHGDTLDALQYLANLASARKNINGERDKSRVTIDIEGYRAKREETLRALARRMAAKAIRNNRSVMLEPMTAYERRIIHSEIQGIEGVSTNSIGSDNNRKIVIFLTDKKPQGIFEEEEKKEAAEEITEVAEVIEELSDDADLSLTEEASEGEASDEGADVLN